MKNNVFTQLAVLFRSVFNKTMRLFVKPDDVMEYAIDKFEDAHAQLKEQLAISMAGLERAKENLAKAHTENNNPQLISMLQDQVTRYESNITYLRERYIELDTNLQMMRLQKTDLSVRHNLLETQEGLNKLLGTYGAGDMNQAFNGIRGDIEQRESIQKMLKEIDAGKFQLPPGQ